MQEKVPPPPEEILSDVDKHVEKFSWRMVFSEVSK